MKRFLARYSPLIIMAVLFIVLATLNENFGSADNFEKIAKRSTEIAVLAMGELLVILTAGIDLSIGSVAALSGMVSAIAAEHTDSMWLAILAGVGVGLLCGTINGALITLGRIPPFIVTLGMMMAARGVVYIISDGITKSASSFSVIAADQTPIYVSLVVTGLVGVMLTYTRFGRSLYATGGNITGARLSGVAVNWVRLKAYALCGLCAGLAGVMLAARVSVASASAAEVYELKAIAACVIGGASLMGGEGGAMGAMAGALIMFALVNFCNLNGISPHWQNILVGSLIIILVFYDSWRKRRAGLLTD